MEDALGGSVGSASLKLRDRVLKDGKVLPNSIIDVSKFMDSQVDVNLMDDCAKELVSVWETKCVFLLSCFVLIEFTRIYRPIDSCIKSLPKS